LTAKPRTLLAVLLINAGQSLTTDRLMAALWPERPPPSARRVLSTYVSALRQLLRLSCRDDLPRLPYLDAGYRLEVASGDLDLLMFDDLAERGRQALSDADAVSAARLLNQALALWRGQPAEDVIVDSETDTVLAGLTERRLLAEESRTEAELALGNDLALIARLRLLVAAHPLRERMWGQLMTALYRTGQRAGALAVYQQLRGHLVEELGVEPGPPLRELHQQILAGDTLGAPSPAALVTRAVPPRQLPPDVSHFTGRADELDRLDAGARSHGPAAITVITGTAGVGKTALAIHWAHRVASRFSDGQLFASLGGHSVAPIAPLEVLGRFLRALGIPAERVPGELEEAAAMYRSLLDGKQALIVLDNAAASGQVRPLLPAARGCAVIITSRGRLSGLTAREGAARFTLTPLAQEEAVALLHGIIGPRRAGAEPQAVTDIAARCACLPLALRIAAERATARPRHKLASLAAQLATATSRLDVLTVDDDPTTAVRNAFSWSYQALPAGAARTFRLLGLHSGPDISVPAAAALIAATRPEAHRLLETLTGAHLLEEHVPGRYRFHDLLRIYAAEVARTGESDSERAAAFERLLTWCLHTAEAACLRLEPREPMLLDPPPAYCEPLVFSSYKQSLDWYEAEHPNLVAVIRRVAETGQYNDVGWRLPVALWPFFALRRSWAEFTSCMRIAVACAGRGDDKHGEAWTLSGLGHAHVGLGKLEQAVSCFRQALALLHLAGDRARQAGVLNNLGCTYQALDRHENGARCFAQALTIARETGDRYSEGIALNNLGETHHELGRPAEAVDCYTQSLTVSRETDDRYGEGLTLHNLAAALRALGQHGPAVETYRAARAIRNQADDRQGEGETLRDLGDLLHDLGEHDAARESWRQALAIFEELGDPRARELSPHTG
jgi:DNA-binding SARP family transcriptional activator/tetratricopeptide (TPR) repeat protein